LEGSAFAIQDSATQGQTASFYYRIPQTGVYLAQVVFIGATGFFAEKNFSLDLFSPRPCMADATSLCLWASRFRVTAEFQRTPEDPSSPAAAALLTPDTGYFWFFDPSNVEIVTKVLNGCSVNGHYWFFSGGLTNVGVQITVTDVLSGAVRRYSNSVSSPFAPIQDTTAFATCP
jgi:hypothetical protein